MRYPHLALVLASMLVLPACRKAEPRPEVAPSAAEESAPASTTAAEKAEEAPSEAPKFAEVGQPAPDFALQDLDGNTVKLTDHQGKVVVLEWFNPECPFVKLSHTKGSLKGAAAKAKEDGVVWFAINSNVSGSQGSDIEANRKAKGEFNMDYPILRDENSEVAKLYKAERTPHMYVINQAGILVYAGAIDSSPDGEEQSPKAGVSTRHVGEDGKAECKETDELVRYVDEALADIAADREPCSPTTEAYGCTVKYPEEQ